MVAETEKPKSKKSRPGKRKYILTEKQLDCAELMASRGFADTEIFMSFGWTKDNATKLIKDYPELNERVELGRSKLKAAGIDWKDVIKGNRPKAMLSELDLDNIEQYAARGLKPQEILSLLGRSMNDMTFWKRFPDAEERLNRGRAKIVGKLANALVDQALKGNTTALIFALKAIGQWRDEHKIEVDKTVNHRVQFILPEMVSEQDFPRLVAQQKRITTTEILDQEAAAETSVEDQVITITATEKDPVTTDGSV